MSERDFSKSLYKLFSKNDSNAETSTIPVTEEASKFMIAVSKKETSSSAENEELSKSKQLLHFDEICKSMKNFAIKPSCLTFELFNKCPKGDQCECSHGTECPLCHELCLPIWNKNLIKSHVISCRGLRISSGEEDCTKSSAKQITKYAAIEKYKTLEEEESEKFAEKKHMKFSEKKYAKPSEGKYIKSEFDHNLLYPLKNRLLPSYTSSPKREFVKFDGNFPRCLEPWEISDMFIAETTMKSDDRIPHMHYKIPPTSSTQEKSATLGYGFSYHQMPHKRLPVFSYITCGKMESARSNSISHPLMSHRSMPLSVISPAFFISSTTEKSRNDRDFPCHLKSCENSSLSSSFRKGRMFSSTDSSNSESVQSHNAFPVMISRGTPFYLFNLASSIPTNKEKYSKSSSDSSYSKLYGISVISIFRNNELVKSNNSAKLPLTTWKNSTMYKPLELPKCAISSTKEGYEKYNHSFAFPSKAYKGSTPCKLSEFSGAISFTKEESKNFGGGFLRGLTTEELSRISCPEENYMYENSSTPFVEKKSRNTDNSLPYFYMPSGSSSLSPTEQEPLRYRYVFPYYSNSFESSAILSPEKKSMKYDDDFRFYLAQCKRSSVLTAVSFNKDALTCENYFPAYLMKRERSSDLSSVSFSKESLTYDNDFPPLPQNEREDDEGKVHMY